MSAPRRIPPEGRRRGWCPSLARPMPTGDGLLARVHPLLGRLTPGQLRAVAEGARRHGNGHVDVTTRGNLQIRGVVEATTAPLAVLLGEAGLGDRRADGGPQRLTLTSPLAGLDPAESVDVLALAAAIEAAALGIPGLPAKTLVAIEGPGIDGEGADVRLRPEPGRVAIRLAGGCDEGTAPEAAAAPAVIAALTAFVATGRRRIRDFSAGERAAVLEAITEAANAQGPPTSAREGGSRVSEGQERGAPSPDAALPSPDCSPGTLPRRGGRDGSVADAAARLDVGATLIGRLSVLSAEAPFGRCTAEGLEALAATAEALGCAEIRVSSSRGFVLASSNRDAASALDTLAAVGFVTASGDPRRAVAACPGAPACASGSTPVPTDAERLAQAFAPFAGRGLTAHVSGCAKGCAHPAPAHLTLVAEGGRYRVALCGAPGDASGPLEAFESVLERVSTADPTRPLDQALRP